MAGRRGVLVAADEALGGVGGFEGMKSDGRDAIVACTLVRRPVVRAVHCILTMIAIYKTIFGTSSGFVAQNELISWPKAAPSGLAKVATAVALVLP